MQTNNKAEKNDTKTNNKNHISNITREKTGKNSLDVFESYWQMTAKFSLDYMDPKMTMQKWKKKKHME